MRLEPLSNILKQLSAILKFQVKGYFYFKNLTIPLKGVQGEPWNSTPNFAPAQSTILGLIVNRGGRMVPVTLGTLYVYKWPKKFHHSPSIISCISFNHFIYIVVS